MALYTVHRLEGKKNNQQQLTDCSDIDVLKWTLCVIALSCGYCAGRVA